MKREEIIVNTIPIYERFMPGSMRKVKVRYIARQEYSSTAEVRLYDRLFNVENPAERKIWISENY